jgi:cadmium resistance protein CadD (predicted permease)
MLQILSMIVSLGSLICWIIVVVKMFQNAGALQGILGIICGIWALIWGWMNSEKVGKNIMLAWTALIILSIVLNIAGGGFNYSYGTTP